MRVGAAKRTCRVPRCSHVPNLSHASPCATATPCADFVLYGVLAWYADGVLPSTFREFGVPRPWNFPCTRAYWREVFNLPPLHHAHATSEHVAVPIAAGSKAHSAAHANSSTAPVDSRLIEEPDATLRAREAEGRCVSSECGKHASV